MRKKWIIGMLTISMIAVMGGCSGTENNSSSETVETSAVETSVEESSEEESSLTETSAEESSIEETLENSDVETSGDIRPDVKEAIDSYESFMNQYCDFMNNYDATDLSMLSEYSELMAEYATATAKFEKIEDEDLNDAELAYYLEVSNRISQNLLAVSSAQ